MIRKQFAQQMGISERTLINLKMNRLARPEQKEPLLRLIIKEYGLSEEWLRDGKGEIFSETEESDAAIASDILKYPEDRVYIFVK